MASAALGTGAFVYAQSLHFWVNDALMTEYSIFCPTSNLHSRRMSGSIETCPGVATPSCSFRARRYPPLMSASIVWCGVVLNCDR